MDSLAVREDRDCNPGTCGEMLVDVSGSYRAWNILFLSASLRKEYPRDLFVANDRFRAERAQKQREFFVLHNGELAHHYVPAGAHRMAP